MYLATDLYSNVNKLLLALPAGAARLASELGWRVVLVRTYTRLRVYESASRRHQHRREVKNLWFDGRSTRTFLNTIDTQGTPGPLAAGKFIFVYVAM